MGDDWRDGFLFLGNHLLLDFINTRPVMNGAAVELLPDGGALARGLGAAGLITGRESARLTRVWAAPECTAAVEALREFRESARQTVLKQEQDGSVSMGVLKRLNGLLIAHPYVDQVVQTNSTLQRRRHFQPASPEDAFAPLADAFADLLTATPASRIRKCSNCVLHFRDTSKKGTRVWCSMKLCGNRAKVAAYAERQRAAEKRGGKRLAKTVK